MSRETEAPLSVLNPSLANVIEDTILFGRIEELQQLEELITDHPQVPEKLRYGIEGLKFFRMHYPAADESLSDDTRQRVSQFDTSWSMSLIDMVRGGLAEAVVPFEEKQLA